jgi:hypothetical protein
MPKLSHFLQLTDEFGKTVDSDGKDPDYPKWIEVFTFSIKRPLQSQRSQTIPMVLSIVMRYDMAEGELEKAVLAGRKFVSAILAQRDDDKKTENWRDTFQDATVISLSLVRHAVGHELGISIEVMSERLIDRKSPVPSPKHAKLLQAAQLKARMAMSAREMNNRGTA